MFWCKIRTHFSLLQLFSPKMLREVYKCTISPHFGIHTHDQLIKSNTWRVLFKIWHSLRIQESFKGNIIHCRNLLSHDGQVEYLFFKKEDLLSNYMHNYFYSQKKVSIKHNNTKGLCGAFMDLSIYERHPWFKVNIQLYFKYLHKHVWSQCLFMKI